MSTDLTMPSSVIGLADLGVVDGGEGGLDGVERRAGHGGGGHAVDATWPARPAARAGLAWSYDHRYAIGRGT